jgi:hypothetical protein
MMSAVRELVHDFLNLRAEGERQRGERREEGWVILKLIIVGPCEAQTGNSRGKLSLRYPE